MYYQHVCVESLAYTLPDEVVTSDELEARLAPAYQRLRLPEGRLELMSGIASRRFWSPGLLPGDISVVTGEQALLAADFPRDRVGALVHGSVCRDYLEPATAAGVHARLGLPALCTAYDVSNACLGLLNGILQVADQIELGRIDAGLVVGTEDSRSLIETTIAYLNRETSLTRADMKRAMASLTIGSASAAILLVHRDLSQTGNRLLGGTCLAATEHAALCRSGRDEAAGGGMQPLMNTDAEELLHQGVTAAQACFPQFLDRLGWSASEIDKTICHQVGKAHRKALLEALDLAPERDFTTFEVLGNTGSTALPATWAMAAEQGHLTANDQVALLGIGSGINVIMLGMQWQQARIGRGSESQALALATA
jgi:3-oxoacyl-[acyl-carrier-protein] synthase III